MKHYKLVEFLSNLKVKTPRTNAKLFYWRLSGDSSASMLPQGYLRRVLGRTVPGGLYVRAGGAWHWNSTKIPLICSVSYFNLGGLELCFGGISQPKPPRGDGTGSRCDTSWQRAQVWNLLSPGCQTTSSNREIPAILVRTCVQNVPGKNGELSPLGYSLQPRESGPEFVQGPGDVTTSLTLLIPSWCGVSRTIWNWCWSWSASGPPRTVAPETLPKGKAGTKMSEWICRSTLNLSVFEIVFSLFAKSECHIQIIKHIWTDTCVFCENQLKVSDIEGKMVLTSKSPPRQPFKNLKKTLSICI